MAEYGSPSSSGRSRWLVIVVVFVIGCIGGVIGMREFQLGKFVNSVKATVTSFISPTKTVYPAAMAAAAVPTNPSYAAPEQAIAPAPAHNSNDVQRELQELRAEVARLRNAQPTATGAPQQFAAQQSSAQAAPPQQPKYNDAPRRNQTGTLTLAYWNNLNAIFAREAAMRSAPPQVDAGNAGAFVSGRTQAFQFAADAIRKLDTRGIDPTLASFGQEIAAWYDLGLSNSRMAESLLGSSDVASRQGAAGQNWQTAEKAHREQNLAINRRGEQLQQDFTRKYGLQFPPMQ